MHIVCWDTCIEETSVVQLAQFVESYCYAGKAIIPYWESSASLPAGNTTSSDAHHLDLLPWPSAQSTIKFNFDPVYTKLFKSQLRQDLMCRNKDMTL